MAKTIETQGTLMVRSDACATASGQTLRSLVLGPSEVQSCSKFVDAVITSQFTVATAGAVGAAFEDVDCLDELSEITLLYLRSSADIQLRLYAVPASTQAVSGTFPTAFAGAETLIVVLDGVTTTTTFLIADQTAAQCAARINAAFALAGIATPRATVVSGQLRIDGIATGVDGTLGVITITGTGAATLGLDSGSSPTSVDAQGQDIAVNGLYLSEFPNTGSQAPTKAQVSGSATVDVVAGGRS